jgi:hypothetical protein
MKIQNIPMLSYSEGRQMVDALAVNITARTVLVAHGFNPDATDSSFEIESGSAAISAKADPHAHH